MQLVILVFVNIIMATIFYLILRLKLEKYASDYREKRLKREMDEIINEFNETAERNITILENRIDVLKRLLERSGIINNIDIRIDDGKKEDIDNQTKSINKSISYTDEEYSDIDNNKNKTIKLDNKINEKRLIEDSPIFAKSEFFFRMKSKLKGIMIGAFNIIFKHDSYRPDINDFSSDNSNNKEISSLFSSNSDLQKELSDISIDKEEQPYGKQLDDIFELKEFELKNMFSNSDDKYLLVSELHNKGYPVELLSRCSGIPIGEIKLVLDLNSSI